MVSWTPTHLYTEKVIGNLAKGPGEILKQHCILGNFYLMPNVFPDTPTACTPPIFWLYYFGNWSGKIGYIRQFSFMIIISSALFHDIVSFINLQRSPSMCGKAWIMVKPVRWPWSWCRCCLMHDSFHCHPTQVHFLWWLRSKKGLSTLSRATGCFSQLLWKRLSLIACQRAWPRTPNSFRWLVVDVATV